MITGWMGTHGPKHESHACNCIGPQNGQPLCPCMMRSVTVENGRYVRREDLGPVPTDSQAADRAKARADIASILASEGISINGGRL